MRLALPSGAAYCVRKMMRRFRVVSVVDPLDFQKCFSVTGGLKRQHTGGLWPSVAGARREAAALTAEGMFAYIVRRTSTGWALVQALEPVAGPADWPW